MYGLDGDFGLEKGDKTLDIGESGDKNDEIQENPEDELYYPNVRSDHTPNIGQEFSCLDEAMDFYNDYAREAGFGVRKSSEKRNVNGEICRKECVCFKQGKSQVV